MRGGGSLWLGRRVATCGVPIQMNPPTPIVTRAIDSTKRPTSFMFWRL